MKKPLLNLERRKYAEAYLFLLPWLVGVLLFAAIPLIQSFIVSFTDATYPKIYEREFIGWANYAEMFRGAAYFRALIEVMQNVLVDIPLIVIFSLFIAVLLNQSVVGKGAFRTIFMLPILLSGVLIDYLTSPGSGASTEFFSNIGGDSLSLTQFFGPETFERFGTIMWRTSVQILIYLAALQTIPAMLYEAASIDGATRWEMFWRITIPFMTPISVIIVIYTFIDAFTEPKNALMLLISSSILGGRQFAMPITASWMYLFFTYALILITLFVGSRVMRRMGV